MFYKLSFDWVFTQVVNYGWTIGVVFIFDYLIGTNGMTSYWAVTLSSTIGTILIGLLEQFWFWYFGDKIAKAKREYSMSRTDWWYVAQTIVIGSVVAIWSSKYDLYYWTPIEFTLECWIEVMGAFYVMQIFKDFFSLYILHQLMHENKTLYSLHKEHHTVRDNAQNLMAYHIDVLDLFLENLCAPVAMNAVQYFMGWPMRIHYCAMVFSSVMDIQIHSINPHAPCLYNPILDYFFRCNVAHGIHHAVQLANYTFIPYHYLNPKTAQYEMAKYDSIMKTNWFPEYQHLLARKKKVG